MPSVLPRVAPAAAPGLVSSACWSQWVCFLGVRPCPHERVEMLHDLKHQRVALLESSRAHRQSSAVSVQTGLACQSAPSETACSSSSGCRTGSWAQILTRCPGRRPSTPPPNRRCVAKQLQQSRHEQVPPAQQAVSHARTNFFCSKTEAPMLRVEILCLEPLFWQSKASLEIPWKSRAFFEGQRPSVSFATMSAQGSSRSGPRPIWSKQLVAASKRVFAKLTPEAVRQRLLPSVRQSRGGDCAARVWLRARSLWLMSGMCGLSLEVTHPGAPRAAETCAEGRR